MGDRAVTLGIGGVGLVMIIEGLHFVLLIIARKHIHGVTVVAFGEFFEEVELVGDAVIDSGAETEVEAPGERDQPFQPLAFLHRALNRAINHCDENDDKQHYNQNRL